MSDTVTYRHLCDGTKVSAAASGGLGFAYRGSFVYSAPAGGAKSLESVAWDEGRVMAAADGSLRDCWLVADRLGCVRAVVDLGSQDATDAVLETDGYLPFGTRETDSLSLERNRWRFAGKEEQRFGSADLALSDFGARLYDPFTARWTTPDPLAAKSPSLSPYAYCAGNPVNAVDPDGMDWYTIDSNGNIVLYKATDDNFDILYSYVYTGPLNPNESVRVNDKTLLPAIKRGSNINLSGDTPSKELLDLFYFVSDHSNVEWGLYAKDKKANLKTDKYSDNVSSPFQDTPWKIHSHPDVKTTDKDELQSMGYWPNDNAFNKNGKLINHKERPKTIYGDWEIYVNSYKSMQGKQRSYVYFPISGKVYNINYNARPNVYKKMK